MSNTLFVASDLVLAQLNENSGDRLRDIILNIVGALTVAVMAARAAMALLDDRFGKMLGLLAGSALVLGICYFPDQFVDVSLGIFNSVTGGGSA